MHFLHPRASASASCSLAAEVPVCRLEENKKKVEREGQTARHPPHPLPLRGTAGQGCSFARLGSCVARSQRGVLAGALGHCRVHLGSVLLGIGSYMLLNSNFTVLCVDCVPWVRCIRLSAPPFTVLQSSSSLFGVSTGCRSLFVAVRRKSRRTPAKQMARCAPRRTLLLLCSLRPHPPMLLSVSKSNYTVMTLQAAVMQNVRSISEAHPREAEVWK